MFCCFRQTAEVNNLTDVGRSDDCLARTAYLCVFQSTPTVLLARDPFKIFDTIVELMTVDVINFHKLR